MLRKQVPSDKEQEKINTLIIFHPKENNPLEQSLVPIRRESKDWV